MLRSLTESLKNLFSSPATIAYPAQPITLAPNYRGLIRSDKDACVFCKKCEKTCPANAIVFDCDLEGNQTFQYNPYLCIYCQECVRECPKAENGALYQTAETAPVATREEMLENHFETNSWGEFIALCHRHQEEYKEHKAKMRAQAKAQE